MSSIIRSTTLVFQAACFRFLRKGLSSPGRCRSFLLLRHNISNYTYAFDLQLSIQGVASGGDSHEHGGFHTQDDGAQARGDKAHGLALCVLCGGEVALRPDEQHAVRATVGTAGL